MQLTANQIAHYTQATVEVAPASEETLVCGITWDSREVTPGCAYLALPGERVDGHDFAEAAVRSGAACIIAMHSLSEAAYAAARECGAAVLQVVDTNQAITDLARGWRSHITGHVIALTGSTGKTTTKNLIRSVLSTELATVATKGNQNNELGVPRTVLEAQPETQAVVVEMGMRGLGQLEELCTFVQPDIAIITNVGESHIELLGTRENIARAKAEVLCALPENGTAVVNAADDYCEFVIKHAKLAERGVETLLYDGSGTVDPATAASNLAAFATDVQLDAAGCPSFTLYVRGESAPCTLAVRGHHNVHNACAAAAVGAACGLSLASIVAGLSAAEAEPGRQEVWAGCNNTIIVNDAYNANPDSMQASLALFAAMDVPGRRFAVLGDMGELGSHAPACHERVGTFAATVGIDYLVCVGELARHIASAAAQAGFPQAAITTAATREEALAYLKKNIAPGDAVLCKASHFMELDRIAKGLLD